MIKFTLRFNVMNSILFMTAFFFFSKPLLAERKMVVVQAYELLGGTGDEDADVGVTISVTNISEIDQTVSWSGGIIANRVRAGRNGIGTCGLHGTPNPAITRSVMIAPQKMRVSPGGSFTLWCSSSTRAGASSDPGGEGFVKVGFLIEEDRGALIGSGATFVEDRLHSRNWGASGSGPFTVNGGRPF
jgi:hypothetical protein